MKRVWILGFILLALFFEFACTGEEETGQQDVQVSEDVVVDVVSVQDVLQDVSEDDVSKDVETDVSIEDVSKDTETDVTVEDASKDVEPDVSVEDAGQDVELDVTVEDAGVDGGEDIGDTTQDTGTQEGKGIIKGRVKLVRNFPNQVVSLLRTYLTSPDYIYRGDLYFQIAEDKEFTKVVLTKLVLSNQLYSTGFYKEVQVENLPEGHFWVRFFIDTQYSKNYNGGYDVEQKPGPMDILLCADGSNPTEGKNPSPLVIEVNLVANQVVDIGDHDLGTLIFDDPAFDPMYEGGYLITASIPVGGEQYMNQIKVVDLDTYEIETLINVKNGVSTFKGDICGFIKGQGNYIFAVGVDSTGTYLYTFDLNQRKLASNTPFKISSEFIWNCRGVSIAKDNKEFLYLIHFKGAGALTNSEPYPLIVLDVTDLPSGGSAAVVEKYNKSVDPFFETERIIRGVDTDGTRLFLLEASWSKYVDNNTVHVFNINQDGRVSKVYEFSSETAEDKCGSTNNWVPAMKVVNWNGEKILAVGNDESIIFYKTDNSFTPISALDITRYGSLITSFAVSPDGKVLYAMPNCKSYKEKAHVKVGIGDSTVDLDRHAVVAIDLTSDYNDPQLLFTDRDFDEDGKKDGGIDLEFLYLKANLLRWCSSCTGSVPPTAYTGPEIVAGKNSIFMRGSGKPGATGLGQVSDIGIYDIATGKGLIFRDYIIWLDGPSARWGFDLNPDNPVKTIDDDITTGAIYWLSK